jgi:type VI secretion system secreted protein Hcp
MKSWIRSSLLLVCLTGFITVPLAEADAATYLRLKGAKSGEIKGGVTAKGFENRIEVISVSHEIISPRDAASGQATGKRQHKPFTITKRIDKASPLLNQALVNNENISEFKLQVTNGAKAEYEITLRNASISSIKLVTDENGKTTEVISFTYQKIEWAWVDGNITATDDWEAPVVGKSK